MTNGIDTNVLNLFASAKETDITSCTEVSCTTTDYANVSFEVSFATPSETNGRESENVNYIMKLSDALKNNYKIVAQQAYADYLNKIGMDNNSVDDMEIVKKINELQNKKTNAQEQIYQEDLTQKIDTAQIVNIGAATLATTLILLFFVRLGSGQ